MSIISALLTASLAAAISFGGGELTDAPVTTEVNSKEVLAGWGKFDPLATKSFARFECPADAPYLTDHEYHPGSGWGIPRGVQIRVSQKAPVWIVTAPPTYRTSSAGFIPSGIDSALITNGSTGNEIYLVLHCTNLPR